MSPRLRLLLASTLLAAGIGPMSIAFAADRKPTKADIPPPPGLNDPGVSAQAPPQDQNKGNAAAADNATTADDPLGPLPKPDSRLVRDKASRDAAANAQRVAASNVTKRQQGDDTVEEYRENGHIWMIKIVQPNGPTQTFMDNDGSGRLMRDPREGPVSPVYYTLYEWK